MKIGDKVVIISHECSRPECPYVGKQGEIVSSFIYTSKKWFRLTMEDGAKITAAQTSVESLESYDERMIKEAGANLLQTIKEEIACLVILRDWDRLRNLIVAVEMSMAFSVLSGLRSKGLGDEITQLCIQAGMVEKKPLQEVLTE